jgi:hypothetical protein
MSTGTELSVQVSPLSVDRAMLRPVLQRTPPPSVIAPNMREASSVRRVQVMPSVDV